jgi:diguanylate cyclase (GGDEF)-like protein
VAATSEERSPWQQCAFDTPRWTRSRLYPLAGLGLALATGGAAAVLRSSVGGRALDTGLWLVIVATLVVGGWLFGRQEDHLRRVSVTDPLTGLPNRRELDQRMELELARAARHGTPLSLLLVDVDRLKDINDRHGHRKGDRALQAVAAALSGSCRAIDVPARMSGDEFAVLVPGAHARDAVQLAARVHAFLRLVGAVGGERVSVSIGIADLDSAGGRDLVDAADTALYRAKAAGRDRFAMHSAVVPVVVDEAAGFCAVRGAAS